MLALAYPRVGTGFGFANAPITNTAVGGLPPARAGVAGAITSTARQLGSALGIAVAGSIIAGAAPAHLAQASRPGWLLVAGCGLFVLVVPLAEFDTTEPHWSGPDGDRPVDILHIFGPQGDKARVRTRPASSARS